MGFFDKGIEFTKMLINASKVERFCKDANFNLRRIVEIKPASYDIVEAVGKIKRYLVLYSSKNSRLISCRDEYISMERKINEHNMQIKKIFMYAENFKEVYRIAISYPNSFDICRLAPYTAVVNEIKRDFYPLTEEVEEFVTHYEHLSSQMNEIRRQYNAQSEIPDALTIPNGYITKITAEEKLKRLKKILPSNGTTHFYSFPKIEQFVDKITEQNEDYLKKFAEKITEIRTAAIENPTIFSNDLDEMKTWGTVICDLKTTCDVTVGEMQDILDYYEENLSEEINSSIEYYEDVTIFLEEIRRQYIALPLAQKVFDLQELEYINREKQKELTDRLKCLLPEQGAKKYYAFPKVEQLEKEIELHNRPIIDKMQEKFDSIHKSAITNPIDFDKSEIKEYDILAKELDFNDKKSKVFLEQYKELSLFMDEILVQYKNVYEANCLLNLRSDHYVDEWQKNDMLERLKALSPKKGTKQFYKFPTVEDLECNVEKHNKEFVNRHLRDEIFEDVNGFSLDQDQRSAILHDEVSSLIVAGAGSGKTLTICGKIKYLIEVLGVNPSDILLLSFSRESIKDLKEKASEISKDLEIRTFHSLGLEILGKPDDEKLVINNQYDNIMHNFFEKEIEKRTDLLSRVIEFYGLYRSPIEVDKVYEEESEMFEDLKSKNFKTLKNRLLELSNGSKKTIKEENVRSYEELAIANFYYINGIEYKYEEPYKKHTGNTSYRQYMPDFHLTDYDIYHEHYGLNREGTAIQFGEKLSEKYLEGVEWKRNLHKYNGTTCIETFSYQFSEGSFFDELKKTLCQHGVRMTSPDNKSIWEKLKTRELDSFAKLVRTFVSLYKSMYKDDSAFEILKNDTFENEYETQRAKLFLDICKSAYNYYKEQLLYITTDDGVEKSNSMIDFDDMILKSTELLPSYDSEFKYKYILVDEFQDISHSRQRFLKALIEHGRSKLFAVGDDWQSIYRFSGSDIDIFTDVEKYFGKTKIGLIKSTHRNSAELIKIMEPFITSNKEQIKKNISSDLHEMEPLRLVYYDNNKVNAFIRTLKGIRKAQEDAHVLVLGRNNKDLEGILPSVGVKRQGDQLFFDEFSTLKIEFKTVHSSKGLEADYVVLVNADDDLNGFPNKMEDDKLLRLVLANKSDYPFAEERRLFYVAVTRTKKVCYILVNKNKPSVFVKELKEKCVIRDCCDEPLDKNATVIKCPNCGGKLLLKTNENTNRSFYGCSNWPFCRYTNNDLAAVKRGNVCSNCGDFMALKIRDDGGKKIECCGCHKTIFLNY